jgi:hypothetical protein
MANRIEGNLERLSPLGLASSAHLPVVFAGLESGCYNSADRYERAEEEITLDGR